MLSIFKDLFKITIWRPKILSDLELLDSSYLCLMGMRMQQKYIDFSLFFSSNNYCLLYFYLLIGAMSLPLYHGFRPETSHSSDDESKPVVISNLFKDQEHLNF